MKRVLCLLFSFSLALLPAAFGQTQERPLRHEVEVVVVDLPVYVLDKQGNPVLDLKPEDFVVLENGAEQKLTHFALIRNDSPETLSLLSLYPAARRHFFFLFDLSFASLKGLLKAREAALAFVQNKTLPTDLIGVATFSVFSGLKIISPFTEDKEQALTALDTLGLAKASHRVKDPAGFLFKPFQDVTSSRPQASGGQKTSASDITEQIKDVLKEIGRLDREIQRGFASQFVSSFQLLSQALNIVSGRKHLIYFSEGFDSEVLTGSALSQLDKTEEALMNRELWKVDTELSGSAGLRTSLLETLAHLANSDCVVHTVDIGGLRGESQVDTVDGASLAASTVRRGQDTLNILSHETGGLAFRNTNDLNLPLEDILRATNSYYLLGYTPGPQAKSPRPKKIEVRVNRPGLQLSYRKALESQKPFSKFSDFEKQMQLVEYIAKDIDSDDLAFQALATTYQGSEHIAQIPVVLRVPGEQFLAGAEKAKEVKLEFYGYALNSSRQFVDYFHQSLSLDLGKVRDKLKNYGLKYFDMLLVRPGDNYKVKCIIRNSLTGEVGSRILEVGVPDFGQMIFSLSPPVLVDPDQDWILTRGYDPDKPSGRKQLKGLPIAYPFVLPSFRFVPAVVPEIKPQSPVGVYFRAYHLKLQPESKTPQVLVQFAAVDAAGKPSPLAGFRLTKGSVSAEPDVYEFFFEGRMTDLPPGSYQLKVTCLDLLAQKSVAGFVPFVVPD